MALFRDTENMRVTTAAIIQRLRDCDELRNQLLEQSHLRARRREMFEATTRNPYYTHKERLEARDQIQEINREETDAQETFQVVTARQSKLFSMKRLLYTAAVAYNMSKKWANKSGYFIPDDVVRMIANRLAGARIFNEVPIPKCNCKNCRK